MNRIKILVIICIISGLLSFASAAYATLRTGTGLEHLDTLILITVAVTLPAFFVFNVTLLSLIIIGVVRLVRKNRRP